jgi:glutamine---fructose-6-phosphate transaminase (isomerizing)
MAQSDSKVARLGKLVLYRYYMKAPTAPAPSARDIPIAVEDTQMFAEAASASNAVARQLESNTNLIGRLAVKLAEAKPSIVFTCARGSSDHAATFAKYLFETLLGVPTVSQAPSISSIYGAPLLHMHGQPFILVSQSGRSPDLLASAEAARKAGALVIALVNDTQSPLAGLAEHVVPLHAGPEKSVAATKSYIASLAAFAHLASHWANNLHLQNELTTLPAKLEAAWDADWTPALETFGKAQNLYVLGRGPTLGVAQEAALKCKETCGIHGEAFSIAEVAHGPMALVGPDFPVLVFPPFDKAAVGLSAIAEKFAARGAPVAVVGQALPGCSPLPIENDLHPAIAPIAMVQSFYRFVNALAVQRGFDPDKPAMLSKVTETL